LLGVFLILKTKIMFFSQRLMMQSYSSRGIHFPVSADLNKAHAPCFYGAFSAAYGSCTLNQSQPSASQCGVSAGASSFADRHGLPEGDLPVRVHRQPH
jgi:hypothetical protein